MAPQIRANIYRWTATTRRSNQFNFWNLKSFLRAQIVDNLCNGAEARPQGGTSLICV